MNRFCKFIQLSRSEKGLLFQAALLLPVAALALRVWGFRRLHSTMARRPSAPSPLTPTLSPGGGEGEFVNFHSLAPIGGEGGAERRVRALPNDHLLLQAKTTARMVTLAAHYGPYRANCLKRSLVADWLLRRQGINCDIRIGVRKESNHFEAHAWIECFGQPLNEGADIQQRFSPFNPILSQEVNWT